MNPVVEWLTLAALIGLVIVVNEQNNTRLAVNEVDMWSAFLYASFGVSVAVALHYLFF